MVTKNEIIELVKVISTKSLAPRNLFQERHILQHRVRC